MAAARLTHIDLLGTRGKTSRPRGYAPTWCQAHTELEHQDMDGAHYMRDSRRAATAGFEGYVPLLGSRCAGFLAGAFSFLRNNWSLFQKDVVGN